MDSISGMENLSICLKKYFFTSLFCSVVNKEEVGAKSIEIHALSSGLKPTFSWMARDGIQVCREACGSHGYLRGIFYIIT